jgi:DNA polymerase elongation subunit (family B)
MQYNISTETLVSQNKVPNMKVDKLLHKEFDTSKLDKNHTMTPNGAIFRTDQKGFLPQLMEDMYNTRTEYKRKMLEAKQEYENTKDKKLLKDISRYNNIQMAKKISLNSAYGAIGNAYFRYFNLLIAEGITTSGQLSIRWIESALNRYLNKTLGTTNEDFVVASDTDSVYITFDRLVNKVFKSQSDVGKITDFLDTIAKEKIEPFIDKSYQDLSEYLNCHSQRMNMKREVIADKAIWTAKKRYILNAWDIEGVRYKEPNLKMMGIEAVKSSTPAPCRQKIKEALKIIMSGDEKMLNTFIQDFHEEFMNLPPEDIGFPRSVNNVGNYTNKVGSNVFNMDTGKVESKMKSLFAKGAPLHTKGAILYNYLISELKLENKYPTIQEGDKIKFVYLKEPNSFLSSSISFITKFPKEFNGKFSIDVQKQFDKSFIEPLAFITDKLKWNIKNKEKIGTLEDFF